MPSTGVAIVGVGETEFARRLDRSLDELVLEACRRAIDDAGLTPQDIDGFVPVYDGPAADDLALALGGSRRFTGPSGLTPGAASVGGLLTARLAIEAGLANNVIVYYGYKGSRPGGPYKFHAEDPIKANLEMPFGWYGQPVYFAAWAQRYCFEYGVKPDDFAPIALAAREWATLTPGAQKSGSITAEDYLASPMISTPLRAMDCCLISDGGTAFVVTSVDRARSLAKAPAVVAGIGTAFLDVTLTSIFTQKPDILSLGSVESGSRALADAGVSLSDVDVAEIYDCFSISMVLQMEDLGFCARGEGFGFAADGRLAPGGSCPVNTNGGHLSYAYMPGMNHIIEATRQIRGERGAAQVAGAEVALVAALGGNDHATAIITKDR